MDINKELKLRADLEFLHQEVKLAASTAAIFTTYLKSTQRGSEPDLTGLADMVAKNIKHLDERVCAISQNYFS